jgi:hypothetical protein
VDATFNRRGERTGSRGCFPPQRREMWRGRGEKRLLATLAGALTGITELVEMILMSQAASLRNTAGVLPGRTTDGRDLAVLRNDSDSSWQSTVPSIGGIGGVMGNVRGIGEFGCASALLVRGETENQRPNRASLQADSPPRFGRDRGHMRA